MHPFYWEGQGGSFSRGYCISNSLHITSHRGPEIQRSLPASLVVATPNHIIKEVSLIIALVLSKLAKEFDH